MRARRTSAKNKNVNYLSFRPGLTLLEAIRARCIEEDLPLSEILRKALLAYLRTRSHP